MCGFIAQLVEQHTDNAQVTGSNPVEALIFFFQASSFQLQPQFKNELFHILHLVQGTTFQIFKKLSSTPFTHGHFLSLHNYDDVFEGNMKGTKE